MSKIKVEKLGLVGEETYEAEVDNINGKRVDSISTLRSIDIVNRYNHKVFVEGYYNINDGGQGNFYWDSLSTEDDNDGTIIKVDNVVVGRFKRIYSGSVNVKWFGAKGDGVFDDTVAFQNASNFISTGVDLGVGNFLVTNTIVTISNSSCIISGVNQEKTKIIFKPMLASTPFINSDNGINYGSISNFTITGDETLIVGNRKGVFINSDTIFTRVNVYNLEFMYLDIGFNLPGDTYSNTYTKVKSNTTRIGWNHPTLYNTSPPSGGNAAFNNTVFNECRFRGDDRGIYVNCGAIDTTFNSCIYDNRIGASDSYSVEFVFANTVTFNGGYNESLDRATFKLGFPDDRGYYGQVTVRDMYCVNNFTTTRNKHAFALNGKLNITIENNYFNGWDSVIEDSMLEGIINYNNNSEAVINRILNTESVSEFYKEGTISDTTANGYYVKKPDGSMTCTEYIDSGDLSISTPLHGGFRSGGQTWTYPLPFIGDVSGSASIYNVSAFGVVATFDNSACSFSYTDPLAQGSANRRVKLIAIGRWK